MESLKGVQPHGINIILINNGNKNISVDEIGSVLNYHGKYNTKITTCKIQNIFIFICLLIQTGFKLDAEEIRCLDINECEG